MLNLKNTLIIACKYTILPKTKNCYQSFPLTFTKKSVKMQPKNNWQKTPMFGAKKLNKPRYSTQLLVVMVETFEVL